MRLSAAVVAFVADVCAGKTNETPRAYASKLRSLITFTSDCALRDLTPDVVTQFQSHLYARVEARLPDKRLSVWSVRSSLATARHFCRWLRENRHTRYDLAARIKIPPEPHKAPRAIHADTVARLARAAERTGEDWERARNVAFLCALRDTGGRLGGLLNATMDGLDLPNGLMLTSEKGGQLRALFLNEPAILALGQWLTFRDARAKCDRVFVGRTGQGLTRGGIYSMLRRLANAAGLNGQRFNPHAWRHAFARDFLRNGGRLDEVSQLLGHSSIRVTADYYAVWSRMELQEAHRRLSPGRTWEGGATPRED